MHALNGTWLRNHTMSLLEIDSYDSVTQNGESRLHGGLQALYCRENITIEEHSINGMIYV